MTPADDVHLALGAYVLHALPPAEEAAFENHLAGCDACRREVEELRETTARLAAADPVAPPPDLRARILDSTTGTRQEGSPRPPWLRRSRKLALALAASAAVAASFGGVAAWQHSEAVDARARAAMAHEWVQDVRSSTAAFTDVLTAPDATLHTGRFADGGSVGVAVSHSQGRAACTAHGLPTLAPDKVYQLWYVAPAGDLRSAGVLHYTDGQNARVLAGPLGDAKAVSMTVEPARGSDQPTTEPLGTISIST